MFLRYFLGAVFAIFISLGLFYFMHSLINSDVNISKNNEDVKLMNFIRVNHEKPVKVKKRVIPIEPKLQEKPQKLKISNDNAKVVEQKIDIQMPKPDISLNIVKDSIASLDGVLVSKSLSEINSGIAVNLMPMFRIPPRYPTRAKMLKKEGFVELLFTITKDGFVEEIEVLNSKPKNIFDKSAIKALSKWKFKPKIVNGKAVPQRAKQTIDYKLR